jgi:hypothetical protein
MRRALRQSLLLLLAAWMPFCCCQARAIAQVIVHAQHVPAGADGLPACCRAAQEAPRTCCRGTDGPDAADRPAADDRPATGRCCDGEDDAPADHGNCCSACKDRVAPPVPGGSIDFHAELDALATMLLLQCEDRGLSGAAPRPAAPDTGPPPRPAGRAALERHSILVI